MSAPRWFGAIAVAIAALVAAPSSHAQWGVTFEERSIFSDTLSVGVRRATRLIDMTNFTTCNLTLEADPPKGAATPRVLIGVRMIKVIGAVADSNSSSVFLMQPDATRSYLSSSAGDSLTYGWTWSGDAVQRDPGEWVFQFQAPNSKWPQPDAVSVDLNNKGQPMTVRRFYLEIRAISANGTDPTRVNASVTLRK